MSTARITIFLVASLSLVIVLGGIAFVEKVPADITGQAFGRASGRSYRYSFTNPFSRSYTPPKTTYTCTDSDGENVNNKGYVFGIYGTQNYKYEDSCVKSNQLLERKCNGNYAAYIYKTCECKDGACKEAPKPAATPPPAPTQTVQTPAAPPQASSTSPLPTTSAQSSTPATTTTTQISAPAQTPLSSPATTTTTQTSTATNSNPPKRPKFTTASCKETDRGDDIFVKGTTTAVQGDQTIPSDVPEDEFIKSRTYFATDSCSPGVPQRVREYYCWGSQFKESFSDCPYGCEDGACKENRDAKFYVWCEDSDSGKDFYTKGFMKGMAPSAHKYGSEIADFCYFPNLLREYYCTEEGKVTTVDEKCTCNDGVCVKETPAVTGAFFLWNWFK